MSQESGISKKYKEAAIVVAVCSVYYLVVFLFKGITANYGSMYYFAIGIVSFFIVVVPHFIYNGSKTFCLGGNFKDTATMKLRQVSSRVWTKVFAWVFAIRAISFVGRFIKGTVHEIENYTFPTLFICAFMLFRALRGDNDNLELCNCEEENLSKRAFGLGTLIVSAMVIGFWVFMRMIPYTIILPRVFWVSVASVTIVWFGSLFLYPKRCISCGARAGSKCLKKLT